MATIHNVIDMYDSRTKSSFNSTLNILSKKSKENKQKRKTKQANKGKIHNKHL